MTRILASSLDDALDKIRSLRKSGQNASYAPTGGDIGDGMTTIPTRHYVVIIDANEILDGGENAVLIPKLPL